MNWVELVLSLVGQIIPLVLGLIFQLIEGAQGG